jgi:hypothetical protein
VITLVNLFFDKTFPGLVEGFRAIGIGVSSGKAFSWYEEKA